MNQRLTDTAQLPAIGQLIYAQARTGSTTLLQALNLHPERFRIANEPFVAGNPVYEEWHTGAKHVWMPDGWPFVNEQGEGQPEFNKHLLLSAGKVLLLRRRNALERIVDRQLSIQSQVWSCSPDSIRTILNRRFEPIDPEVVRAELEEEKRVWELPAKQLAEAGKTFMVAWYEDIFQAPDYGLYSRLRTVKSIFSYFDVKLDDRRWTHLQGQLKRLFGSTRDHFIRHRLAPNWQELNHQFGSDELGRLL
jgi:hypothetical protein